MQGELWSFIHTKYFKVFVIIYVRVINWGITPHSCSCLGTGLLETQREQSEQSTFQSSVPCTHIVQVNTSAQHLRFSLLAKNKQLLNWFDFPFFFFLKRRNKSFTIFI